MGLSGNAMQRIPGAVVVVVVRAQQLPPNCKCLLHETAQAIPPSPALWPLTDMPAGARLWQESIWVCHQSAVSAPQTDLQLRQLLNEDTLNTGDCQDLDDRNTAKTAGSPYHPHRR